MSTSPPYNPNHPPAHRNLNLVIVNLQQFSNFFKDRCVIVAMNTPSMNINARDFKEEKRSKC